jgi:hypothetical protein
MIGWVVGDGGVLMAARHAMAGAFRQRGTGRVANPTVLIGRSAASQAFALIVPQSLLIGAEYEAESRRIGRNDCLGRGEYFGPSGRYSVLGTEPLGTLSMRSQLCGAKVRTDCSPWLAGDFDS